MGWNYIYLWAGIKYVYGLALKTFTGWNQICLRAGIKNVHGLDLNIGAHVYN